MAKVGRAQFPDANGAPRRYRRSDLVYDIECKRLAVEYVGDPDAQSVAEVAWMSCLHATAEVSAYSEVYLADVADQLTHMTHAHGVVQMVDLRWKDYLHGPYATEVNESYKAEERALTEKTGSLREVVEGTAEYAVAVKKSTQMRPLLNRKRDATWKTRWVMRGDTEVKILLDGFLAVGSVPRDRRALCSHPVPDRWQDAVLQAVQAHLRVVQSPVRWPKTFVNWLTKPEVEDGAGLERGHNEPCVFRHPGRDPELVLYVDDLWSMGIGRTTNGCTPK
jgi:hypothetical protein